MADNGGGQFRKYSQHDLEKYPTQTIHSFCKRLAFPPPTIESPREIIPNRVQLEIKLKITETNTQEANFQLFFNKT